MAIYGQVDGVVKKVAANTSEMRMDNHSVNHNETMLRLIKKIMI